MRALTIHTDELEEIDDYTRGRLDAILREENMVRRYEDADFTTFCFNSIAERNRAYDSIFRIGIDTVAFILWEVEDDGNDSYTLTKP